MRWWIVILLVTALPTTAFGQGRTSGETQAQQAVLKADRAFDAKNMKEAIRLYNQALVYDRSLTPAYVKLAIAYYATNQYRPAVAKLSICLQVSPAAVKCHLWMGLHLLELKQKARGIQALQSAVKLDWKLPLAMRELGQYYFREGNWARAEKAWWTFLKFRDKSWPAKVDFRAHFFLGRIYLKLGKFAAAQTHFTKATKLRTRHQAAKLGLADALLGRGYYNTALNLYLGLEKLAQRRPIIHFNLARCYYRMRRKGKALAHLKQYAARQPNDIRSVILEGDIYFFFRNYDQALATYKRATQRAPGNVAAKVKYGEALLQQKKLTEAHAVLSAANRSLPNNPEILLALGRALLGLKKATEAVAIFGELLKLRPKSDEGLSYRGEAQLMAKQVDQAIADFEGSRKLNPANWRAKRGLIDALNRRARSHLLQGQVNLSLADLSKAFALDPSRIFTNTNLGIAYLRAKRYTEALRHLTDVHTRLPRNFAVNRLLARLYFDTGKTAAARSHYVRARGVAKKLPARFQAEVEIELGALLAGLGETNSAVDVLKSAVSNAEGTKQLAPIAQGNLAIALMDRGYRLLESGKGKDAVADLELANSYVEHLKGNQPLLVRFLLAMAYLEAGQWAKAAGAFDKLRGRRLLAKVLKPPFDKIGAKYFQAYTQYRRGGYEAAATAMKRLMRRAPGKVKGRLRAIIASAYEFRAVQHIHGGQHGKAAKMYRQATTFGLTRQGRHNEAVSLYRSGKTAKALAIWQGGGMPATALCNVGTHYDNAGNPQNAYTFYKRCQARGGAGGSIVSRMNTIQRLFGYK